MTLRERVEALAASYEARAYEYDAMASPERASSLEDQVECRREAGRLRLRIADLRTVLDTGPNDSGNLPEIAGPDVLAPGNHAENDGADHA